jgi:DNA polymerase III subunit beta
MILPVKELKEALSKVAPAYPNSAIVPILEHVWIETDGTKVSVKLSNLRETIETTFETKEVNKKEIVLPYYKDFSAYMKLINEVEIELIQKEGSVEIKAGGARSKINGEDEANYPQIPNIEGESITFNTEYFHLLKDKILPFASIDELRPAMTGAMLRVKSGFLIMDATNSHQLARLEMETDMKDMEILFNRSIPEISTTLFKGEKVDMWIDGTGCKIADSTTTLTSRLLEERYPDVDAVLPPKKGEIARVDRKLFIAEMQKARLFVNNKSKMIKANFSLKNIEITGDDLDFDKSYSNKIDADGCKELLIGLDVDNLLKSAQKMEADELEIHHYNGANKAIKMVEDDYLIITMPMMITETKKK